MSPSVKREALGEFRGGTHGSNYAPVSSLWLLCGPCMRDVLECQGFRDLFLSQLQQSKQQFVRP